MSEGCRELKQREQSSNLLPSTRRVLFESRTQAHLVHETKVLVLDTGEELNGAIATGHGDEQGKISHRHVACTEGSRVCVRGVGQSCRRECEELQVTDGLGCWRRCARLHRSRCPTARKESVSDIVRGRKTESSIRE